VTLIFMAVDFEAGIGFEQPSPPGREGWKS